SSLAASRRDRQRDQTRRTDCSVWSIAMSAKIASASRQGTASRATNAASSRKPCSTPATPLTLGSRVHLGYRIARAVIASRLLRRIAQEQANPIDQLRVPGQRHPGVGAPPQPEQQIAGRATDRGP